jgi:hypothetical protein
MLACSSTLNCLVMDAAHPGYFTDTSMHLVIFPQFVNPAYSGHRERSVRFIVNGSGRSEATLVVFC